MKAVAARVFDKVPGVGSQIYQRMMFPALIIAAGFRKDKMIPIPCMDSFKVQGDCSLIFQIKRVQWVFVERDSEAVNRRKGLLKARIAADQHIIFKMLKFAVLEMMC